MAGAGTFFARGVMVAALGAFAWSRYAGRTSTEPASDPASSAPPFWTPSGMQARARDLATEIAKKRAPQVGVTEAELMGEQAAGSPSAAPTASTLPQRLHVYQADAATLGRMLAEHAREPSALPWAQKQERAVRALFSPERDETPHDLLVECRSKSCTALLTFASASSRDDFLQRDQLPLPSACHGVTMLPRDLSRAAPYQLSVLYLCR